MRPPPRSTLFPYTTLFRSRRRQHRDAIVAVDREGRDFRQAVHVLDAGRAPDGRSGRPVDELSRIGRHDRSEEHTSELQSLAYLVCRLLLEKKKTERQQSTT